MNSHKRHRRLVLAVVVTLGLVPAVVLALQSIAANAEPNNAQSAPFQVAQAQQTPPATTTTPPATTTTPPATTTTPPATTTTPAATPTTAPATPPSLIVGGVDIGKQVSDAITTLRLLLGRITDAASAQAMFSQIEAAIATIERIDVLFAQLTPEQRTALAAIVNPELASLNQLFDQVLATPGVAEVLKPTIDALRPKLAMLTGARTIAVGGAVLEIVIKEDKDKCLRARRGGKPDPSCCVEKVRLVSGPNTTVTSNTGRAVTLTSQGNLACISPTGEITVSKSEESILPFDVAAANLQAPGEQVAPGAPGGGGQGAPGGGGQGAPGGGGQAPGAPGAPPATPISLPGGGSFTTPNPGGGTTTPTPTPCVNPPTPSAPTCP
jgi:hypothetical protein